MAGILSIGWYVPPGRRTAAEIARVYGVSEEAVRGAGLESHAVPGPDDHPSTMAARSVRSALQAAKLTAQDLDLLIFVGMTRDYPPPWVGAFAVLHELGARRAAGFDLMNRCPAIQDGLWVAAQLVRAGTFRTVAVCAGDRFDHLYGPHRKPKQISDVFYSAGSGAMIVSAAAKNEIVAFSHLTGSDLSIHSQNVARAGGTRVPTSVQSVEEGLHSSQNDMSVGQLAQLRAYLGEADRHNIRNVCKEARFEEIDLLICAPLDVKGQIESIQKLGLDAARTLFVLPRLGHMGASDSIVAFGLSVAGPHRDAKRIVMSSRSLVYSNALAIRGGRQADGAGIAVEGTPAAL